MPEGSFGFGYVNVGAMLEASFDFVEELSETPGMSELAGLGMLNPEQLEVFQGAGFSMGFDPKGIRFDFVSVYDKDGLTELMVTSASPNKAIDHTPANTLPQPTPNTKATSSGTFAVSFKAPPSAANWSMFN